MTLRPALVNPQVVPYHWQNQRLPGPMSLANDTGREFAGSPDPQEYGVSGIKPVSVGWPCCWEDPRDAHVPRPGLRVFYAWSLEVTIPCPSRLHSLVCCVSMQ